MFLYMNDIYQPQTIPDQPFPVDNSSTVNPSTTTGQSTTQLSPQTVPERTFPQQVIAVQTIGDSIDTQSKRIKGSYQFDKMGAIQIGEYENGVSGQILISPSGIVATNKNNQNTFTLDGSTGNATFLGTVQAGSVIAGAVNVGSPSVIIDGANDRIIVNDGTNDIILIGYQSGGF